MKEWERVGEPQIVHDGWRKVFRKTFIMPNGKRMDAEISDMDGWRATAVIALTETDEVVIARQFRCGPERIFDELPGGLVEKDEEPEAAARRELLEETGYSAGDMQYLGKIYKHAWMATSWHYFLATNCEKLQDQQLESTEDVEVALISIKGLIENARNAKMTDTEAVFLAYEDLKQIERNSHEATD